MITSITILILIITAAIMIRIYDNRNNIIYKLIVDIREFNRTLENMKKSIGRIKIHNPQNPLISILSFLYKMIFKTRESGGLMAGVYRFFPKSLSFKEIEEIPKPYFIDFASWDYK